MSDPKLSTVHDEGILSVDDSSAHEKGLHSHDRDWDEAEERALVRKIDLHVFPMLCIIFGLSLLDRTNISAAYIAGAGEDIGLAEGSNYSIALLVFFIGYGVFELPSNLVIRRIGARWWLSFLITVWVFPGAVFIIGSWYKQYETGKRVSFFYMAALITSGFGPIFAYLLSLIKVGGGMYREGWRWIFIIEGVMTIVAGIAAIFFLGDFPENAKWLSNRQRHVALARVQTDKAARNFEHPGFMQALRMLFDWKLAIYCLQYFIAASSVYSLAYFFPIILRQGMGFGYAKAQLLTSPPYVFAIIASMTMAWISDKWRVRWALLLRSILCAQALFAIIGLLLILYVDVVGARYFGMFLAVFGTQANVPGTLAYGQNQTAKLEKRGIISAAMITIGAAGGVAGSTIFRSQDAPEYLPE
ncbi:hypothetical protein FKW77_001768 [Venturia effusa]|uniref:Major facilitator superfamily (MFS) profile domain-containing protein n=1 Tax=Venturia effusa TaxID=50376 RepID=A0A517LC14_9PEZI|nr:hypothetical protein FKW77_001768 [Venturia effusa]